MEWTPEVGSELAGYRLLRLLGQGGTGLVYEAEHMVLRRSAALKMLLPDLVDEPEHRERLLRESRTVASLDHPAVIPIYDAGEDDGVIFVAMRLVRGSDLRECLLHECTLPLDTALAVLEQVAGALDAAHREGLVHRDVKPANVLLEERTDRVYLTDFGIAKQAHAPGLTRTGFFVGTVDYAAPEQIQGLEVGPPADVYALGCMLYECLSGRAPFGGDSVAAVARGHLFDDPPSLPAELGLPAELDAVLARALAKDEHERQPGCRALVLEVRAATGGTRAGRRRTRTGLVSAPRRPRARPSLPSEASPLIGRSAELHDLCELLQQPDVRLVTLTGLGGVGKTRLAVAAARALADRFEEVAYTDLSLVAGADGAMAAVADTLGVQGGGGAAADEVAWRLAGKPALLVLDSFERVLPAAAELGRLLGASPQLVVLATSQAPLRIPQEHRVPLHPLALPDPALSGDSAPLVTSPAIQLFLERARAVRPDFPLTPDSVALVARICAGLDGLPLAIELAAARVNLLSPQAILTRLQQRFELLAEEAPAGQARHRTLKETIDWTYELLDEGERGLFARLSVFAGSWSLDAADAVCGTPGSHHIGEMLNAFASLIDKSLVRQGDGADGEPRFAMIETIRHYARDRLAERDERDEIHLRHARRYLALVEAAEPELVGPGQIAWLARLDEEADNVWAALAWSVEHREQELAMRIAGALPRYWSLRGHAAEARLRLEPLLAETESVPVAVVAKACFAAGYAALGQGDLAVAAEHFERSLGLAEEVGETRQAAAALAQLGWLLTATGRHEEARAAALRALALLEGAEDATTASGAYSVLAAVALAGEDDPEATRLYERALGLRRELGDRRLIASSILDLARNDLDRSDPAHTTVLLEEALELAGKVDDGWTRSLALSTLGVLAVLERNAERARRLFADALATARRRGDTRVSAECIVGLAAVAGLEEDLRRSARLLGAGRALREGITAGRTPAERVLEEVLAPALGAALGPVFEAELAAGGRLDPEEMLLLALGDAPEAGGRASHLGGAV